MTQKLIRNLQCCFLGHKQFPGNQSVIVLLKESNNKKSKNAMGMPMKEKRYMNSDIHLIHKPNNLENQLILSQIITILKHCLSKENVLNIKNEVSLIK